MTSDAKLSELELAAVKRRRAEFDAICAIERIAPTSEQKAMFEMFDRERWPHKRRLAYVIERARKRAAVEHV